MTYNPGSLEPEASSFLYSDIAMAALDTPAAGIPTWALMFSQLPDPGAIDADGTGYHVVIEGYGNTGTGTTGSGGSDFRRRIAENTLGALASLDDFETFLFGSPNGLYQNSTGSTSTIRAAAQRPPAPMTSTPGVTTPCPTRGSPRAVLWRPAHPRRHL